MLQFILGRACSGKTEKVLELLGEDTLQENCKAVLLVPEQFSFEAERMLLERFSETGSAKAAVLSFTRLFEEVGRICGTIAGTRMSESDSIVLMGKALQKEKGALKCFDRFAQSQNFAAVCASTVAELKTAAVSSKQLYKASLQISGRLKAKLEDLALIMDSYNMEVAQKFIDPRDTLDRLYDMLLTTRYFENKKVYIDGFKGFTGQQFKIISRIIEQASHVIITLCCDDTTQKDGTFDTAIDTRQKIEKYARQVNVEIIKPVVLDKSYYKCEELKALEKGLFAAGEVFDSIAENVTVCSAATPEDEADYAMYTVRKMVRQKGMRYKDFAIIARDASVYERYIVKAASKYNVACFVDIKVSASSLPLFVFVQAALDATISLTTDGILKYLKTGLCAVEYEQVARLENYAYIWDLKGKDWTKEWTMDPEGLRQSDNCEQENTAKELEELNAMRKVAIEPILNLRKAMNHQDTVSEATALWELLTACDTAKKLAGLAQSFEKDGKFKEADLTRRSFDVFCDVLDHIVRCLDANADKKEFISAFKLAAQGTDMGSVPQTLDQVLFGSADRIRTHRPKAVIALGLNGGEWPQSMPQGNLLSAKDRDILTQNGVKIANMAQQFAADENFLCYTSLCAPSEYLYAVYHAASGKDLTPCSYVLTAICETLPSCKKEKWPKESIDIEDIETKKAAFSVLAGSVDGSNVLSTALTEIFEQDKEWSGKLKALKRANKAVDTALSPKTVEEILPKTISMSPTATETFCKCRFSYFCKYILKAKIIEKANLNVLQRGTMVHFALQMLVERHGNMLRQADDGFISAQIKAICDEYIASIKGLNDVMDARMRYLFYLIQLQITEVALRLRDELAQSGFVPIKCELVIDKCGDIKPLEFSCDGITLLARGKIDRVDAWGGYLRIVDYKTGSKKFRLSDVLVGQNMQMLLYLYTLLKSDKYGNYAPAGILYMTAQRSKNEDNSLTMNGLLCENEELVRQMERENAGQFVPKLKYTASGALDKNSSARTYIKEEDFNLVFKKIDKVMEEIAHRLACGDIAVSPTDCAGEDACEYCNFKAVCGIETAPHENNVSASAGKVIQTLGEELGSNEI